MSWRNSSLLSRCRARIRSPRTSSRARIRSRSASSSTVGTRTGCSASIINRRSTRSASRWSVLSLSCAARSIFPGAATTHPIPAAMSARASPYPVGPASYAARVGPGNLARNSTTFAVSPDNLAERSSPDSASSVTASTLRACTSRPAQLRTFAMGRRSFHMVDVGDHRGRHPRCVTLTARHAGGERRPTFLGRPSFPPYELRDRGWLSSWMKRFVVEAKAEPAPFFQPWDQAGRPAPAPDP